MIIEPPVRNTPVFYWMPGQPDLTTRDEQSERISHAVQLHHEADPDSWIEQLSASPVPVSRRPRYPFND